MSLSVGVSGVGIGTVIVTDVDCTLTGRRSAIDIRHYDGQPAPTAGARGRATCRAGCCSRATKEAQLLAARQSAMNTEI